MLTLNLSAGAFARMVHQVLCTAHDGGGFDEALLRLDLDGNETPFYSIADFWELLLRSSHIYKCNVCIDFNF